MPVARHEQQHRELGAEARHAALADVAARLADDAGELMNHPRAVAADRRNGQVLLHLEGGGSVCRRFALSSVPGAGAGCDPRRAERAPLRLAWRRAPLVTCHASILVPPRTSAGLMFSGSLVAIVTPMRSDGALDLEAWSRLIDFHLANGTSGIVVGGTTGESATLRDEELRELTVCACQQLRGRMAVIAGAGTSSTAATVERVGWLSGLPIDGLLLVTPAYNRPTQEGLYLHFAAAAAAARKPLLLYNVPARTAVDMKPATVARLAKVAGIVGVKEAVPEAPRVRELIDSCGRDFVVLSGDDATARASIAAGARGVISVTADRKSTRLNSSHRCISYAVFCLKKKNMKVVLTLDYIIDIYRLNHGAAATH